MEITIAQWFWSGMDIFLTAVIAGGVFAYFLYACVVIASMMLRYYVLSSIKRSPVVRLLKKLVGG